MKALLREPFGTFKSSARIKEKIPAGDVVESFLFYSGQLEANLAANQRFVIAHTSQYVVYEFWRCVLGDPGRLSEMVSYLYPLDPDPYHSKRMFYAIQEKWHAYKDPFVRSAFFYILNQCSSLAYASCGEFQEGNITPARQMALKRFTIDNFHIEWNNTADFTTAFQKLKSASTLLIPVGKFSQNLFEDGKSRGMEMTTIYHAKLYEKLAQLPDRKWMVIYENSPRVRSLYKDYNIEMINQYGRPTTNSKLSEELLIANF